MQKMEMIKTQDKNGREMYFKVVDGKKVRVAKEVALKSEKTTEKPSKKIYKGYIYTSGVGVSSIFPDGEIFLAASLPWEKASSKIWEMSLSDIESLMDLDVDPSDIKVRKDNWGTRKYIPFKVQVSGKRKYDSEDEEFVLKYANYMGPA